MLFASGLLTWMIAWMIWQKYNFKKSLEKKMAIKLDENKLLGLLFLAFITVAREGVEIVLFLRTLSLQVDYGSVFMGFGLGAVLAVLLSYLLFKQIYRVKLTKFFTFSSVLLIFFAAGLLASGIHALQEAHVIPVFIEHVWNINSFLNEKDALGEFFATFFGYDASPSLLMVFSYSSYLFIIAFVWRKVEQKRIKELILFK
jgi:high-affinity iron transporter